MAKVPALVLASFVLSLLSPMAWARKPRLLQAEADFCDLVCDFSLCVTGDRAPVVTLCTPGKATMSVLVPLTLTDGSMHGRNRVRVSIRGASVILVCLYPGPPCIPACLADAECAFNGPLSRCIRGTCVAHASCP